MPSSRIQVQFRDGSKPSGTKVVLGFSGGMTKPAYTDRGGVAIVEHASTGTADIYVSGSKVGSLRAPGSASVTIR